MLSAVNLAINLTTGQAFAQAPPNRLPSTDDLSTSAARANARGLPLVVMVSLDNCPFCKIVRENYLWPLVRDQQLPVVQVDVKSTKAIVNFAGNSDTHDQFIRRIGVRVAPTVLFFDANGKEIAERLRGSYISDFYGSYLDERLTTARKAIQASKG